MNYVNSSTQPSILAYGTGKSSIGLPMAEVKAAGRVHLFHVAGNVWFRMTGDDAP